MKKTTDLAKTQVLFGKHSLLNVYEMGSVYIDQKKFTVGFQNYMQPCSCVSGRLHKVGLLVHATK